MNNYIGERNSQRLVICTGNGHIRLTLVALKCLEMIFQLKLFILIQMIFPMKMKND